MWAPTPPAMPPGKCSACVGCEFFSSDRLLFAVEQIRFRVYMNLQLLPRDDRTSARPRGRTPLLPINLLGLHVGGRRWVCVCVCARRTKVPSSFVPSSRLFFLAAQCKQDMEKTECKYILTNPCLVLHISSLTMVECWIHKRNNICSRYRHNGDRRRTPRYPQRQDDRRRPIGVVKWQKEINATQHSTTHRATDLPRVHRCINHHSSR